MRNSSEFSARIVLIGYKSLERRFWLINESLTVSVEVLFAPENLRNLFGERLFADGL